MRRFAQRALTAERSIRFAVLTGEGHQTSLGAWDVLDRVGPAVLRHFHQPQFGGLAADGGSLGDW